MSDDINYNFNWLIGVVALNVVLIGAVVLVGIQSEKSIIKQKSSYAECLTKTSDTEWCVEQVFGVRVK